MPNIIPTTSYGWVVSDLKDLSEDLNRIALETSENITEVEATFKATRLKQLTGLGNSPLTIHLLEHPFAV